jgi:hypothetical protein
MRVTLPARRSTRVRYVIFIIVIIFKRVLCKLILIFSDSTTTVGRRTHTIV